MNQEYVDIGIDLGTTYSVIAVKGNPKFIDDYQDFDDLYFPALDVKVIPAPNGDQMFPSVVWIDLDNPEEIEDDEHKAKEGETPIVFLKHEDGAGDEIRFEIAGRNFTAMIGEEAKDKAEEGEAPITFSKREIGTDGKFKMAGREFTAKEVSTIMLRYFKECAERALGRPVRRAVVTHPAYFDPGQVQETREAAQDAGFDMELPEQMMMEPAAAALAYTMGIETDPLRVLTYDLGGGTFDVTVLERREGVITMKAFDGDHLLGGYDFDRALLKWIRGKLKERGTTIPYDEDNPDDRGRQAQLMKLAEDTKFELALAKTDQKLVPVMRKEKILGGDGKKLAIPDRINRLQYAELIAFELNKTINCCFRALLKAERKLDSRENLDVEFTEEMKKDLGGTVDLVLLVGGSTHGKWVANAVGSEFDVEVEMFEPDRCVAVGAAISAGQLPKVHVEGDLELQLEVPATADLDVINVAGEVRAAQGATLPPGMSVVLQTSTQGELGPNSLKEDGGFAFMDVELAPNGATEFTISVLDSAGEKMTSKNFQVEFKPAGAGGQVQEILIALPKPLYILTAAGLEPIAEEGEPLPARLTEEFEQIRPKPELSIEIYQEDTRIGAILIDNIPEDAGPNRKILLDLEITAKNSIEGTATVINAEGREVVKREAKIDFPPIKVPELPELMDEHEELENDRLDKEANARSPKDRLRLAGPAKNLSAKIAEDLQAQPPDRQKIFRDLSDLRRIVHPKSDDMDPPKQHFFALLSQCLRIVHASEDAQIEAIGKSLKTIKRDGEDAAKTKNHREWAVANDNLAKQCSKLKDLITPKKPGGDGNGGEQQLKSTIEQKQRATQDVSGLRAKLNRKHTEEEGKSNYATVTKPNLDELEKAIDRIDEIIDDIDDGLPPEQAHGIIGGSVDRHIPSLAQAIEEAHSDLRRR